MLFTIIGLGWGLDNIFGKYSEQVDTDELTEYRLLGNALATSLDHHHALEAFVNNWQKHNQLKLNLLPLSQFPMPESLKKDFFLGKPLVLESNEHISMHFALPLKAQVLTLILPPIAKKSLNHNLRMTLTSAFYVGILFIITLWLYPLIKNLIQLGRAAKSFGEGNFAHRIKINSTSYISEIQIEFNHMAQRIETLVNDNKLLGNAVSHDLRTPLARLRFGIEVLQETTDPITRKKYENRINHDIYQMEKLVDVLLNYARIEQSMIALEHRKIDLTKLVDECIGSFLQENKKIKWQPSQTDFTVWGDINYLSMLVNNLLNNAEQYCKTQIFIEIQYIKKQIHLTIEDDGPGIPKEKYTDILKPFTRGENSFNTPGFGMGLAIVSRIALWHNATLSIDNSRTLGGAKFSLIMESYKN